MWIYEKRLMYPVRIQAPNPALARAIIARLGGADGELSAAMRYLSQRCAIPCEEAVATLTDIGTEELAHFEILGAVVHQLIRGATPEALEEQGFCGEELMAAPFASAFCAGGEPMALLNENMAAEQRARAVYDDIIRMTDDPDVLGPIKFLRQREITHSQRFGEVLRIMHGRACGMGKGADESIGCMGDGDGGREG